MLTIYLISRLSSFFYRLSSIVKLFVPLRFAIIFYSKIFSIELTPTPPTPSFPWFQTSPIQGEGSPGFGTPGAWFINHHILIAGRLG